MFGFGQEIRRPNTKELTRDRKLCKGNVLSRRKSIEQLAKEELGRLVLPGIHKSRSNNTSSRYEQPTKTKSYIRRGYTFDLRRLKADNSLSLDEDDIEQLLSLKSLDSLNNDKQDENYYVAKYSRRSSRESEGKNRREYSSRGDNDSGFSESSANQDESNNSEKQHRDRKIKAEKTKYCRENTRGYATTRQRRSSFPDISCPVDLPSRIVVRKAVQADTGASMCTQSMNSLSADLAMFKDAVSRGHKEIRVDKTNTPYSLSKAVPEKDKSVSYVVVDTRSSESNTVSSPTRSESVSSISAAADSSFAVFKRKRKNLSRSQKSRESKSSSESPLSGPSEEEKHPRASPASSQPCAIEITHDTSCRKKSVASETVDGCCTCVSPPRVRISLKDDLKTSGILLRSNKKEVRMPTTYYDCYTPVTSKLIQLSAEKGTDFAPLKIHSKVATMQRALAEFKERKPSKILSNFSQQLRKDKSVSSDPEISLRKNTPIKSTSHEWLPQMKLSDDEEEVEEKPSVSANGETLWSVNYKCDEWLNRWIQGNHQDYTQEL